ncbi:MarR family transcriptional regulator [Streptomyces synnematoformans]|uniref:MarR family winged helix-turn-helix transcriptional regulator n=1 Tax=Streptomyces synnematoformans TaxID=415721 RepID=A0ABN2ZEI0_9ACTN
MSQPEPRPPSLLDLPSYLAGQVSRYGRRRLAEVLAREDLLLVHHAVLCALDDAGPRSQQQVADALDLDKSHLVGRIDLLEQRGLLSRTRDPADRRRHRLALTPAGHRLLERLRPVAAESQRPLLAALTEPEREQLMSLLRRALAANDAARLGRGADRDPDLAPRTADDDEAPPL